MVHYHFYFLFYFCNCFIFLFYSLPRSQQPVTSPHPQFGNPATVSTYLPCEYRNKHGLPFRVESALPLTRSLESGDQAIWYTAWTWPRKDVINLKEWHKPEGCGGVQIMPYNIKERKPCAVWYGTAHDTSTVAESPSTDKLHL